MAPYSMDLRERVARAWDGGEDADTIAATFEVSRALPTSAALSTLWRAIDRLQLTVKKNRPRRRTTSP
jgi:transposase